MIQTDGSTRKRTSEKGLHGRAPRPRDTESTQTRGCPRSPVLGTWDSNNLNRRVPHPFRVILRNGWESECPDLRMQAASTVIPSIGTRQLANHPSWPCQPHRGRHFSKSLSFSYFKRVRFADYFLLSAHNRTSLERPCSESASKAENSGCTQKPVFKSFVDKYLSLSPSP